MTNEKILEVLKKYEEQLHSFPYNQLADAEIIHCRGMIPQMVEFLSQGRRDKVFRWLGFMQGVFFCKGMYSVKEMANHNRMSE